MQNARHEDVSGIFILLWLEAVYSQVQRQLA
jgi:hypothetical protein